MTGPGDHLLGLSLVYWLNVGLIVAARYVDIRYLGGLTTELKPANLGHWKRHTAALVPLAAGLWALAVWVGS